MTITRVGQARIDDEFARLRRDTVDAVAIGNDGSRTAITIEVDRIPDGEHAGYPVYIETGISERIPAIEFDGRRFESRHHGIGAYYWEEVMTETG